MEDDEVELDRPGGRVATRAHVTHVIRADVREQFGAHVGRHPRLERGLAERLGRRAVHDDRAAHEIVVRRSRGGGGAETRVVVIVAREALRVEVVAHHHDRVWWRRAGDRLHRGGDGELVLGGWVLVVPPTPITDGEQRERIGRRRCCRRGRCRNPDEHEHPRRTRAEVALPRVRSHAVKYHGRATVLWVPLVSDTPHLC